MIVVSRTLNFLNIYSVYYCKIVFKVKNSLYYCVHAVKSSIKVGNK